jgi:hypothetical protein
MMDIAEAFPYRAFIPDASLKGLKASVPAETSSAEGNKGWLTCRIIHGRHVASACGSPPD